MLNYQKLEAILESSQVGPDCGTMSAENLINLIDRRAPEGDFDVADVFSVSEIEALRSNENVEGIKDISKVLYDAIKEMLSPTSEQDSTNDDEDEDLDDTVDAEAESAASEELQSHADMMKASGQYFANYKRGRDVSAKIKNDMDYDVMGLIARRGAKIPIHIIYSVPDIMSEKELVAIRNHPNFKKLAKAYRDQVIDGLNECRDRAAVEIEESLIEAFLHDKVLTKSLSAEAAYRAGFTDSDLRLNELGERHARDLVLGRMGFGEFVLEATDPAGLVNGNDEAMDDAIKSISKTKALISIRPNLNRRGEITIHKGRLGRKQASVKAVSIKCTDAVVRPSGQNLAQNKSEKTVHAGFIGQVLPEVIMPTSSSTPVTYNPHKGDKEFKVNGKSYTGGGVITMVGYKAFKVK